MRKLKPKWFGKELRACCVEAERKSYFVFSGGVDVLNSEQRQGILHGS